MKTRAQAGDSPRLQVTNSSSPAAKIELFRLFRGREDVYPWRFESHKTGNRYAPACANEWVRGVCENRRSCAEVSHRRFLPVTDEVVASIFRDGTKWVGFVMGVYPMLLDETCLFLAVDFDRENWQADAGAFVETCRHLDVPAALERSRSGNGGHVWFFFEQAVSASVARKLGSHLLTETMERRPDLGLGSYDRLFPNQDTLPKGGFGNLIALPLQAGAGPREHNVPGRTFQPISGSGLLASVLESAGRESKRGARGRIQGRILSVRMAVADEEDDAPWTAPPSRRRKEPPIDGPLPESIELVVGDQIYISKENLPPALRNRLVRLAISEPGILPGPGDASPHLRQAAHHSLCGRTCEAHRVAARLSGRGAGNSGCAQDQDGPAG
jgi:hypothetical protein